MMLIRRKDLAAALFLVLAILFGAILIGTSHVRADSRTKTVYTSVCLAKGDSLWSLAKEYGGRDPDQYPAYMDEVRRLNHLSSDTIHEGSYLILPVESGK